MHANQRLGRHRPSTGGLAGLPPLLADSPP